MTRTAQPLPRRCRTPGKLRDGVAPVWARYTDLVVERGEGSWLTTIDGQRYLDYTSGIGVTNTGHAHPKVAAAIADQAAKVIHAQQNIVYHKPGLELHERLPRFFPAPADGESGRPLPVQLRCGGGGGRGQAGQDATRRPLSWPSAAASTAARTAPWRSPAPASSTAAITSRFWAASTSCPSRIRCGLGAAPAAVAHSLAAIDELFATMVYPDDVAAFLVEPILGEGGYVIPADGFLPALRELADQHGILLITDEIQTGLRPHRPLLCVRVERYAAGHRGHGQGHRVRAATVGHHGPPLAARPVPRRAHGGTYGGNAVACAAALATLDVIEEEGLVANAERQGERLLAGPLRRGRRRQRRRGARPRPDGRDRVRRAGHAPPRRTWPRASCTRRSSASCCC